MILLTGDSGFDAKYWGRVCDAIEVMTPRFCFPLCLVQVRRHDCSRQWPVDCGHESLCAGAHVERTEEQGHPDSHLLAWQPRVDLPRWFPVLLLPAGS